LESIAPTASTHVTAGFRPRNEEGSMSPSSAWLKRGLVVLASVIAAVTLNATAQAQTLTREPAAGELRLGQRVLVDDGSCPAGQIKQVTGARLTAAGVERARGCVPRKQRR
jgi:hypothetical protein